MKEKINLMNKLLVGILFAFIMSQLSGCGSSRAVQNTWMDPELKAEDIDFKQVVVLALLNNNDYRKVVENEIVKRMVNRIGVQAYKLFDREELKDVELVKKRLVDRGFDGALVVRLVGSEDRKYYTPGSYPTHYYEFSSYYAYSYGYVFDPGGRMNYETVVNLEINIYSLKNNKMLWTGETTTYMKDQIRDLVGPFMKSLAEELAEDGLLELDQQ